MGVLVEHPICPDGDGRERFAAALLPLDHSVVLLEHQVDVVALQLIEPDGFLVLRIVQGKAFEPKRKRGVLLHSRKGRVLSVVFPPLPAQQALEAGIVPGRVVLHCLIDRHRRLHLVCQKRTHLAAVRLVDKGMILLDKRDLVAFGLAVLPPDRLFEIEHHLFLRELDLVPLLYVHSRGFLLRVEQVQILAAAGVAVFGRGMHLDLIQELLRLVRKVLRRGAGTGKLQQNVGFVLLQIRLRQRKHLLVEFPRFFRNVIVSRQGVQQLRRVPARAPAGRVAFLLPELQLCLVFADAELCEYVVRQPDLSEKAELLFERLDHALVREVVREE